MKRSSIIPRLVDPSKSTYECFQLFRCSQVNLLRRTQAYTGPSKSHEVYPHPPEGAPSWVATSIGCYIYGEANCNGCPTYGARKRIPTAKAPIQTKAFSTVTKAPIQTKAHGPQRKDTTSSLSMPGKERWVAQDLHHTHTRKKEEDCCNTNTISD